MHLLLIALVLVTVWVWRQQTAISHNLPWTQRWGQSLICFTLPPLLLLGTALSVVLMGGQGHMWGMPASHFSHLLSLSFLAWAIARGLQLLILSWQDRCRLQTYPHQVVAGETVRLAPLDIPASAQVGVWQPEIFVTSGLVDCLDRDRLEAVLAHERAHAYYQDTFWFFWLGWLRAIATWLPGTETLWQELLLLRELRADRRAVSESDALNLAEALLAVAGYPLEFAEARCAPLSCAATPDRLQERIDALLENDTPMDEAAAGGWDWRLWAIALLPLAILPFHCYC